MATFTGTGSNNSNYTGTLTVTESSYSIADNTSTVAYSLVLTGSSGYYFQDWNLVTEVSINGTAVQSRNERVSMPAPSGGTSTYTVCSGTVTVPHNNDGTKTIAVYAKMSTVTTQAFLPGTINMPSGLNGTLTLTTIPRASTMTVPSLTIGSAGTFTVTAASNSFTHTITYSFEGLTGTAATLNAGVTTASWTPPNTFYAKLPNSVSGTVAYVLHTYSGATEVGTASYTGTVSVGSTIKPTAPTVTLSPVNTNAWISARNLYVGGYTKLRVQSSATAGTGATMASYTISGAFSATGADVTTTTALTAGSKSITVTATDSRGRTNSTTQTVTFLSYSSPSLTTFTAVRGTYSGGSWTTDVNGNHIRVEAVGTVSLSANGNTGTVTVKIGATNPAATSGNYYYFTNTNATTSYTVTGAITDSLGNGTSRGLTVPTVEVPLNVNVDLPGVGFGMIAQSANRAEVSQNWSLVANGKYNTMLYMPTSFLTNYSSGNLGYLRIAVVTVTAAYASSPITFMVRRELDDSPVNLTLRFGSENTVDPSGCFLYYDDPNGTYSTRPFSAFAYKEGTSAWGIYVLKSTADCYIDVTTYVPYIMQTKCTIAYIEARQASIPAGATVAVALHLSVKDTFTVNSGYFRYDNTSITTSSRIVVSQNYASGQTLGYLFITQVQAAGYAYVYVRNPDRTLPADNTSINVSIFIDNG